jgi:hypothetical protein
MEQNYYRHAVAKNLKKSSKSNNRENKRNKIEWKIITKIKNKMRTYELIITKKKRIRSIQ